MNKFFNVIVPAAAAILLGLVAINNSYADSQVNGNGIGNTSAGSQSTSGATGVAAGNNTTVTIQAAPIPTDTTVNFKNVPNVSTPGLTTTLTETCMGSWSAGVAVSGFGLGGGKTEVDQRCANRLDARQLDAQGYKVQAREVLCGTPEVRSAFKRVHDVEVKMGVKPEQMSPVCAADILEAQAAPTAGKQVKDSNKQAVYSKQ